MKPETQKHRQEIMQKHGHEGGYYIQFFGTTGRPEIIFEEYGSEIEVKRMLRTHISILKSKKKRNNTIKVERKKVTA